MSNPKIPIEPLRKSTRRWTTLALAAVSSLVLAALLGPSAAHAQYGDGGGLGGGFGGFDPSMMPGFGYDFGPEVAPRSGKSGANRAPSPVLQLLSLVNHPAVQDELKLTDDQKAKLKDLAPKPPAAGSRKPGSGSRKATGTPSSPKTSGGSNASTARSAIAALEKQLDDLLKADQRKRLGQIILQVDGMLAVAKPDIAKKINLSPAQLKKVQSIVVQMRKQVAQVGPINPPPTDKTNSKDEREPDPANAAPDRAQIEQIQEAAVARVTEVLKPAQKDAFDELQGPPFDVAKLRPASTSTPAPADAEESPKARPSGKSRSRGPGRQP